MRFPTFSAGFMLAINLALGQATQTPTTGSGGAVIGLCRNQADFPQLQVLRVQPL